MVKVVPIMVIEEKKLASYLEIPCMMMPSSWLYVVCFPSSPWPWGVSPNFNMWGDVFRQHLLMLLGRFPFTFIICCCCCFSYSSSSRLIMGLLQHTSWQHKRSQCQRYKGFSWGKINWAQSHHFLNKRILKTPYLDT